MPLRAGCPRCRADVEHQPDSGAATRCPVHGDVRTMWLPDGQDDVSYDAFTDHLGTATGFPTYLPWPMSPGWSVTDFGWWRPGAERVWATVTCVSGPSELDGPVDVFVVAEEPGAGLGARCASMDAQRPGRGDRVTGRRRCKVRIGSHPCRSGWCSTSSPTSGSTARCSRARPTGAGCGWCCVPPRRCCC